jgi:hypothetical protein
MMSILLYACFITGFCMLLLLSTFGKDGWSYLSVDAVLASLNSDFSVSLYTLGPVVLVFLLSIATRQARFADHNWYIAVGIVVIRIASTIVSDRARRGSLFRSVFLSVVCISIARIVNEAVMSKQTVNYASLHGSTIVLLAWLGTVLVMWKLVADAKFGSFDDYPSYRRTILHLYDTYQEKFRTSITIYGKKREIEYRLLFAIMIAEDMNRPGFVRIIEWLLFRQKSVQLAQEIISGSYKIHTKETKEEYALVRLVAADYNGGAYPEIVADIYYLLKDTNH